MSTPNRPPLTLEALVKVRQDLLAVPPSRRVAHLIDQPNVRVLVRRLCPQDLLIAVHAAGVSDSLELIEVLPPGQVQSLVDLECWRRDRIEPRALASWLSVLYAASPERALAQVVGLDAELVTLFLKLHTRVFDLTVEEEPEEVSDGALRTPDQRYLVSFISPPNPEGRDEPDPTDAIGTDVARRVVAGLIAREPFTASRYLEAVRWELPSELEETSLRWRQGRLTDLGFYDLYEAMGVYAPTDLSRPPRVRAVVKDPAEGEADTGLALYVDEYRGAALLRAAGDQLDAPAATRLRRQLVALANRVAAARALSPGDLEGLAASMGEAAATTNLGLEYLTRGDLTAAQALLGEVAVVELFRAGHTLAWELGKKARSLRRRLLIDEEHSLLGSALEDLFTALSRRVPRLYAGLVDPGAVEERPFESLAQLARAAEVVAETAFAAALLLDVLGFAPARAADLVAGQTNLGDAAEVTLDRILATALGRALAGGELEPTPLTAAELGAVQARCREGAEVLARSMRAPLLDLARPHLPLPGASDEAEAGARVEALARRLADRLVEELGALSETAEARFVSALICELE